MLVVAHDVGTKLWQDVDSPPMRLHAEWLLRVYGDELARPTMQAAAPHGAGAAGTLALIERLLAEKDQPGYVLFSPGPVMTRPRLEVADIIRGHGDDFVDRYGETLSPEQRRALIDLARCRTAR